MRHAFVVALVSLVVSQAQAAPKKPFEGYWATSLRDCRQEDRPSSRTFIDLGRRGSEPILDRYENHCRIRAVAGGGGIITLRLRCHEFWDEFRKRGNGRDAVARIAVKGPDSIAIDGENFRRCRR